MRPLPLGRVFYRVKHIVAKVPSSFPDVEYRPSGIPESSSRLEPRLITTIFLRGVYEICFNADVSPFSPYLAEVGPAGLGAPAPAF